MSQVAVGEYHFVLAFWLLPLSRTCRRTVGEGRGRAAGRRQHERQAEGQGTWYEGAWVNDVKQGEGTQTYVDEQGLYFGSYTGSFSNNLRSGYGTFTYASGYVQQGQWQNDEFMS